MEKIIDLTRATMTHCEWHDTRLDAARRDVLTVTIYKSDGSDGHSSGTWGYLVSTGGWDSPCEMYGDGGYSSPEDAREGWSRGRGWSREEGRRPSVGDQL